MPGFAPFGWLPSGSPVSTNSIEFGVCGPEPYIDERCSASINGFRSRAGLGMTVWTALAFQGDAANTGLVQRVLLFVYFTWIVLVGAHLLADRSL